MDKSLLIAVFVPTTDEARGDFKGGHGELATGYPVGTNLILTAGHILKPGPPYYRDERYPLRIGWHCSRPGDPADWTVVPDKNIVWPSQDDLDAVLIRCPLPGDPVVPGIVSHDRPLVGMKWTGEGFPDANRYTKQRCTNSFSGNVCSKTPNASSFELTVEQGPEKEDDWRGISGMPVFAGRKILGVVRSDLPNSKARKLAATPTWKLLDDEAFRKAIGYDDRTARVKKVKGELIKALGRSPAAVEALIEQELLGIGDDIVGLDGAQRAHQLAERLLETDIRVVVEALRRAHRSLCEGEKTSEQQMKAAEIVTEVAQRLVPALYDYGVIQWTRSQQRGGGGAVLMLLPTCIKTVAEIIMAGADKRATRFRHRTSEHDQPEGELSLPQLPECGIDPSRVKVREALENHLLKKFNPGEMENFRRTVDDYLLAFFPRPESGAPERTRQERITLTADLLENMRRDRDQTFYMLFYLPEDAEGQNAMRALIQSLQDDYRALMFLCLDRSFEQERQDRALVDPFCRMLPIMEPETPPQKIILPMSTQRFKIALSFPGEHRGFVEPVAARLADRVGRDRVLYDKYYEAEFARPDLDTYLQRLYHDESELIAVFLCADYERKDWCGLEWRAIRDLIKKRQTSTVMPLRFDNTEIPGLFSTDGYVWIGGRSPQEIADLILQRLQVNAGQPSASPPSSPVVPPPPSSPSPALLVWRKKLAFLETEEAKAVDPAQKFKLQEDIAEAKAKIRELGGSA
ncbi:MAG: TIR domain-containing protein [Thiobacillaceae bacterium]|jgi:hypothetical protein|nr:TIR domain-containing protein [Thiobacillaceae bacterium]